MGHDRLSGHSTDREVRRSIRASSYALIYMSSVLSDVSSPSILETKLTFEQELFLLNNRKVKTCLSNCII